MRQLLVDDDLPDFAGPGSLSVHPSLLADDHVKPGPIPVDNPDWFGPIDPKIPRCPPPKRPPKGANADPKVVPSDKNATNPPIGQVGEGPSRATHPFGAALRLTSHVLDLNPRSPLRPVDYRRQIALLRVTNPKQAPSEWVDHSTRTVRFLRTLVNCHDDASFCDLARKWPVTTDAAAVYCSARPQQRWELEARILAQQPFDEIEARMAMRPGTVARYEQLFFSVMDRITCSGYIQHHVIRLDEQTGEVDLGAIWRHYGYHGGPLVLDAIIQGSSDNVIPEDVSDVGAFIDHEITMATRVKALLSIVMMPLTERTGPKILKLHLQHLKMAARLAAKACGQGLVVSADFSRNMEAFLEGFGVKIPAPEESLVGRMPPPFVAGSKMEHSVGGVG